MTSNQDLQFNEGQRWVADNESALGLGTVIELELRQVTLMFPATGETRIYARENAPLTRIAFAPGDRIKSEDQWEMEVESVSSDDGYLTYHGKRDDQTKVVLEEIDLDNRLRFNTPRDRLFAGQLDRNKWFRLRSAVYEHRQARKKSLIHGLSGARVATIPHQIYIANEVGNRLKPRVLLADEVGLGKTIEAGLVLHKQLTQGLIQRVLLVVPEALLHQWLVEMLRKFNLHFHLMDEDRFDAQMESTPTENPFLSEQLMLCSLDTLTDRDEIQESAVDAAWDCIVVDEAHHLEWAENAPSKAYNSIESLAAVSPAVLLLTATPEQLGRSSHFARLKLLDPERFSSLKKFESEEKKFTATAELANKLLGEEELVDADLDHLSKTIGEDFDDATCEILKKPATRQLSQEPSRVIAQLIDRHGTGRVLFRNTRRTISGFPDRELHLSELAANDDSAGENSDLPMQAEAEWLQDFLDRIKPERSLVIFSQQQSVLAVQERLRENGIQCAVFHEGMSIVDRDRSAAWFADVEDGCRLLICSEIGSEGRNFQFLHHVVLFELPDNPDLLEQRIGRLDRIGQRHTVDIHLPTVAGSRDHLLSRWYHEGLGAFEKSLRVGSSVKALIADELDTLLDKVSNNPQSDALATETDALIKKTRKLATKLESELETGRDRLLELNSNRSEMIAEHLDLLRREDRDWSLRDFMTATFDGFGVEYEEQTNGSWILTPSDNMHIDHFPGLTADGLTITFDRELALEREELTFLTWDHPMVNGVMDLILDESLGQTNAIAITTPRFPKGIALIESIYIHECVAPEALGLSRYLDTELKRFLLGSNKKDYTSSIKELEIDVERKRINLQKLRTVLVSQHEVIRFLLDHSDKLAANSVDLVVKEAREQASTEINAEIARLKELRLVNPAVREDEIEALTLHRDCVLEALGNTQASLVGIRVMFNL